jgi:hypothetical protein
VGASVTRLDAGLDGLDGRTLAVSVLLVVASIAASRVLRRGAAPARTQDG